MSVGTTRQENLTGLSESSQLAEELRQNTRAVKFSVSRLGMRRTVTDRQRQEAAEIFGALPDVLSVSKSILNKRGAEIRNVQACLSRAHTAWEFFTSPYPEKGIRLIREDRVIALENEMAVINGELIEQVEALNTALNDYKEEARQRLGTLYNEQDYPHTVIGRFSFAIEYVNVEPDRRLLDIHPEIYQREVERVRARFSEAIELTEAAFQEEFAKLVAHLADRLTPKEDGTRKSISTAAIENITKFFDRMETMPIRSSQELEDLVNQAKQVMAGVDLKRLKKSDHAREEIREAMAGIMAGIDSNLSHVTTRRMRFGLSPVAGNDTDASEPETSEPETSELEDETPGEDTPEPETPEQGE